MTDFDVSTSADFAADAFLSHALLSPREVTPPRATVSFEFLPPNSAAMEDRLWQAICRLTVLRPAFMSVKYGAGGSTRDGTFRTVTRIQREAHTPAAAHLTSVDAERSDVDTLAESYWAAGIRHIVALRGDGDAVPGNYHRSPQDGYPHADALVRGLRRLRPFEISVAAYPETHPEAECAQADLDALKRKVDAGATRAITQFFFDIDAFARFLERAQRAGIDVPIVPGILPITKFAKTVDFAKACNVGIPREIHRRFEGLDDDPHTLQLVAATVAAEQCDALTRFGVQHFHFYTLNRAELSVAICHLLGVRAERPTHDRSSAAVHAA